MPDLRDVLRQGADVTTGLPDMPAVWAQAVRERRRRRLATGLVVAAALVVVALVGSLVGPGAGTRPAPVVPARLPTAELLPELTGPLESGRTYDVRAVGLPFGFTTAADGWVLAAREQRWVSLHRQDVRVNLQQWDGVLDPSSARPDRTGPRPVPADLAGWIEDHPRLAVRSRSTATVAGEPWVVLEVAVRAALDPPPAECRSVPCVLLGAVGGEPVDLLASERALVYVRADDPQTVLMVSFPATRARPGTPAADLTSSLHERPLR